jgi:SAM-dependent methyltransferase
MLISRSVASELLDGLAVDDPAARRSRHDLQRIHRAMGTRSLLLREWRNLPAARTTTQPLRVLEIGAGDGTLLLGLARALGAGQRPVELTLLDQRALVDRQTMDAYRLAGWTAVGRLGEVFEWMAGDANSAMRGGALDRWDLILANLFLHHFEDAPLARLLRAVASRTDRFLALEPRRSLLALGASHLVGAIGANQVTRTDSVLSVRAGFRDHELSALWPAHSAGWQLREYPAGLFSHGFCAQAIGPQ